MVEDLKTNYAERGELSGYFVLQNIKYGTRYFDDYWIFINSIDQEGYDLLMSINGTTTADPNRDFNKIRKYLTGYIRDIYYTSHDTQNPVDPNISAKNKIIYIFEGYYENGVLQQFPQEKFGRHQVNSKCYIGFFTRDV